MIKFIIVMNILFEDENIVVVEKEPGIDSEKISYQDIFNKEGQLYCVHRLDKEVGGVIIYAKNSKAANLITQSINDKEKYYLAIVEGDLPDKEGVFEDFLYHQQKSNKTYIVKNERKGVKKAILCYEVLDQKSLYEKDYSLLKVRIITGRTHQIRIQFASRKHPIIGDRRYGSKEKCENIALWSNKYIINNPITNEKLTLVSYPSNIYPWSLFNLERNI